MAFSLSRDGASLAQRFAGMFSLDAAFFISRSSAAPILTMRKASRQPGSASTTSQLFRRLSAKYRSEWPVLRLKTRHTSKHFAAHGLLATDASMDHDDGHNAASAREGAAGKAGGGGVNFRFNDVAARHVARDAGGDKISPNRFDLLRHGAAKCQADYRRNTPISRSARATIVADTTLFCHRPLPPISCRHGPLFIGPPVSFLRSDCRLRLPRLDTSAAIAA